MTSEERRFPRSVYEHGEDPDPRFSLANERTFLAWVRTSLAFVAAGLAVEALQLPVSGALRLVISLMLILAGLAAAVQAWFGWTRTERAMRHVGVLPSSGLKLPIVVILGIVCVAVVLGLVL
jgi:putative membrane protein